MTVHVFSCARIKKIENQNGGTKKFQFGIFTYVIKSKEPTTYEQAFEKYLDAYKRSDYYKDDWILAGEPSYYILNGAMIENFAGCIDDGKEETDKESIPKPTPANGRPTLKLV